MIRLGLDASLRVPTCAVSAPGGVMLSTAGGAPVESFVEVIRDALRQANLGLEDVDEIVACVGPGSYMGVRSAVATANALALGLNRPVTGVLSVDALAVMAPTDLAHTVAVPAGRGRWYVAAYRWQADVLQRESPPQLVDEIERGTWRAKEPNIDAADGITLSALGVVTAAATQPHLATETRRSEVVPHLPPASIGSRH